MPTRRSAATKPKGDPARCDRRRDICRASDVRSPASVGYGGLWQGSGVLMRREPHARSNQAGGMNAKAGLCGRAARRSDRCAGKRAGAESAAAGGELREGHARRFPGRADEPRRAAGRTRAAHDADRRDAHLQRRDRAATRSRRGSTSTQHDEEGLQSVAVDPNFEKNRWVYAYYSPPLNTPADNPATPVTQRGRRAGRRHRRRTGRSSRA